MHPGIYPWAAGDPNPGLVGRGVGGMGGGEAACVRVSTRGPLWIQTPGGGRRASTPPACIRVSTRGPLGWGSALFVHKKTRGQPWSRAQHCRGPQPCAALPKTALVRCLAYSRSYFPPCPPACLHPSLDTPPAQQPGPLVRLHSTMLHCLRIPSPHPISLSVFFPWSFPLTQQPEP